MFARIGLLRCRIAMLAVLILTASATLLTGCNSPAKQADDAGSSPPPPGPAIVDKGTKNPDVTETPPPVLASPTAPSTPPADPAPPVAPPPPPAAKIDDGNSNNPPPPNPETPKPPATPVVPPAPPPPFSLLYQKDGGTAGDNFGDSVAMADVNKDGKADIIVGAPYAASGAGSVTVYSGADGTTVLYPKDGGTAADNFGVSVAAGDVNGDGYADFIVGANGTSSGAGSAYVYSGANGNLLFRKDGGAGDYFGLSVAMAGDVNADGKVDVIVGAKFADPSAKTNAGSVYVYSGADGSQLYKKDGENAGDQFGGAVASAGDVNGDGKSDFIVGAPSTAASINAAQGSAYVYSGADGALLYKKILAGGLGMSATFGFSVASAGDVNVDGKADFIVGAPNGTRDMVPVGNINVYSGANGVLLFQIFGDVNNDDYGVSISGAGDINGDGRADFMVGAYGVDVSGKADAGRVYLYSGADGSRLLQKDGVSAGDNFGRSVAGGGDVNGDGKPDFIVGVPYTSAGSAYVYASQ